MTADARTGFYAATLSRFIPDRASSVLIVGGGDRDRDVFSALGFRNVVISNLDTRTPPDAFAPFTWRLEDAEQLTCADDSFDYVVVHAALHHCRSPHRALLEMYRVARLALLAFESRDSALMRAFERFHMTQTYEHAAVFYNEGKYGGVRNTAVPNYIYRWTEREVEKTIRSYAPFAPQRFTYFYGHDIPVTPGIERGAAGKRRLISALRPAFRLFAACFPRQQNLFAFAVAKPALPEQLYPWLKWDHGEVRFSMEWGKRRYRQF